MHRLFNLMLLVRPHNVVAAVLSVAVGYGITAGGLAPWHLLAGVATATAGGNVINDLEDRDIDGINRPSRPLPSTYTGRPSSRAASATRPAAIA